MDFVKKDVLHVMHYVPKFFEPGGGRVVFVRGLISHLKEYGIQQSLISNSSDGKTKISKFENVSVYLLPEIKVGAYWFLKGLPKILKENKSDIIHVHGYGEYMGDLVCLLKIFHRLNAPLILNTHGSAGLKNAFLSMDFSLPFTHKERLLRFIHFFYDFSFGRLNMKIFDKIVLLSNEEKKYLSKIGLEEDKTLKLPIAINDIFFDYTHNLRSSKRTIILYSGRIDRSKGIDILLNSMKELKLINVDIKCLIVGPDFGYKSKCHDIIDNLGISDRVEIKDNVIQEDLLQLYSSAIVTVLPSFTEGFPLALVESMSLGTPFIATPVGAIQELVNASKGGLLIPINDSNALTQAILRLLKDSLLWEDLSKNGKNYAKNFSWIGVTRMYYRLYSEMKV